nr:2Fe-2S iron-sulfur cluster-binding protein [Candidatus Cloacimonadota bacterium]
MKKITLKLNGELRHVYVDPEEILLDVLREKLGVKSPKCGCDRGDCGACAVLLNGKSIR